MKCTLAELPVGSLAKVKGYKKGLGQYRQKLTSMGITPNTHIQVTRIAPMGDPVEILIRDYNLSLRKHEAQAVLVEV